MATSAADAGSYSVEFVVAQDIDQGISYTEPVPGEIPELRYPLTIDVLCGLVDVKTTGKTQYTYLVGEPGFQLDPVSFEQFPSCGYSETVVATSLPSFVTMELDQTLLSTATLELVQFDDNALEGEYTIELDYVAT